MTHETLIEQSMAELQLKTEGHNQVWKLREIENWNVDLAAGKIVFNGSEGLVATCDVQVIGTFNTQDSTWLWGWDHPSIPAPQAVHAQCLHDYGVEKQLPEFTTLKLETTEEKCWEYTALACKLNDAQGAYRGPTGPTLVFMTFGTPSIQKPVTKKKRRWFGG